MNYTGNDPAYPAHGSMGELVTHGLTKRELFAAMAMQGLGETMKWDGSFSELDRKDGTPEKWAKWVAIAAVRHADALLAELERTA